MNCGSCDICVDSKKVEKMKEEMLGVEQRRESYGGGSRTLMMKVGGMVRAAEEIED